jgi:S1-C subfamily serine protease
VITDSGDVYDNVSVSGTDPLNDIAFLKIANVSGLPTVTLGDSKNNAIGMPVWAIGNSAGTYQNTVTEGNISALGRSIYLDGTTKELTDLIQTDAAINIGNAGGPLVNLGGEVVGINTVVTSNSAQGLGFAIPISSVKGMLKELLAKGTVERAFLGINYVPITPSMARTRNLPVLAGNFVFADKGRPSVVPNSPAEKAGVKDGDIIIGVNGIDIGVKGSVLTLTGERAPGEVVELRILRGENELTLQATLTAYSET